MTISTLPASLLTDPQTTELSERLDAAKALLGVSPSTSNGGTVAPLSIPKQSINFGTGRAVRSASDADTLTTTATLPSSFGSSVEPDNSFLSNSRRRGRSSSAGLDALAFLATKEQDSLRQSRPRHIRFSMDVDDGHGSPAAVVSGASSLSSTTPDSSDSEHGPVTSDVSAHQPTQRRRSMSNPEGMDRRRPCHRRGRVQFILPEPILERELAEASTAIKEREERLKMKALEEEEAQLSQDELLRRARSRLLEDISEGNVLGEKGHIVLPHTLAKYKNLYNKNGRVGIYTPAERAAIIARFHDKRTRRVWNKRIRYSCRKNLADRRMRVKGRFVKRSAEEAVAVAATATANAPTAETDGAQSTSAPSQTPKSEAKTEIAISKKASGQKRMPTATYDSGNDSGFIGMDSIDPHDPNTPFCPTEDMPYRRPRRHTIT